jgi:DNA polymerase gamma 1
MLLWHVQFQAMRGMPGSHHGPATPRVVVGHNVSYDRGRVLEEYSLDPSANRFIDTMALHVAVSGISSPQRPAWTKYQKLKETENEKREEAVEAVKNLLSTVDKRRSEGVDAVKQEELRRLRQDMEDSLLLLQAIETDGGVSEADISSKRWEDLTSANSLVDVAKLHCGIEMDKKARTDFMTSEPQHIRDNLTDYLNYCANDVCVTHSVYTVTLPAFLTSCPHPISFAGILTMGSSFLTVDQSWESYLEKAETVYREMEETVEVKLRKLAEDARTLMDGDDKKWVDDPWLSQLDWTPKVARKSRGITSIISNEVHFS